MCSRKKIRKYEEESFKSSLRELSQGDRKHAIDMLELSQPKSVYGSVYSLESKICALGFSVVMQLENSTVKSYEALVMSEFLSPNGSLHMAFGRRDLCGLLWIVGLGSN